MPRSVRTATLPTGYRRIVAFACAALVFALTLVAASPLAHRWLHEQPGACKAHAHDAVPASSEVDRCAVVLFASGVALPVGPIAIAPPTEAVQALSPVRFADVFLVAPRYLRQPERGPPVNWVS